MYTYVFICIHMCLYHMYVCMHACMQCIYILQIVRLMLYESLWQQSHKSSAENGHEKKKNEERMKGNVGLCRHDWF